MINKVGYSVYINNIPSFKSEESAEQNKVTVPEFVPKNKGLDALAAYNEAMVKKEITDNKLNMEPLTPIAAPPFNIADMDGEKIYSSDGVLQSVIRRDEKTYTIYTPDKENPDTFSLIETYNKEYAKHPVKTQTYNLDEGVPYIYIDEFDPVTGDNTKSTSYLNGNIESISRTYNSPDGKSIYVSYDYNDKNYLADITYKNNKDREIYAYFDDNKQLEYVSLSKTINGIKNETAVEFYKGAPYKITASNIAVIPNNSGKEFLTDMKPAEFFNKIENIKEIEGDKTYYSNGALESNTFDSDTGKTTVHFLPDGSCDKINTNNKEIVFEKGCETIKENLEDGRVKETVFYKDGDYSVTISDDKTYRKASFNSDNKPTRYSEGTIENGDKKDTKALYFDENGMLDWAC